MAFNNFNNPNNSSGTKKKLSKADRRIIIANDIGEMTDIYCKYLIIKGRENEDENEDKNEDRIPYNNWHKKINQLANKNGYICHWQCGYSKNTVIVSKRNTSKAPEYVIKYTTSKNEVQALEDFGLLHEKDALDSKNTIMMPFLGLPINTVLDSPNKKFSMQTKILVLRNFFGAIFNFMGGEYGYPNITHSASQKYGFDPRALVDYSEVVVDHTNFNVYLSVGLSNAAPLSKCMDAVGNSNYKRRAKKKYAWMDERKKEPLYLPCSYFTDLAMALLKLVSDQCNKWKNIEKNDNIQKVLSILPQIQKIIIDDAKSRRIAAESYWSERSDGAVINGDSHTQLKSNSIPCYSYEEVYDTGAYDATKPKPKRSAVSTPKPPCDKRNYANELRELFSPLMKILLKEDEGSLIKYKSMSHGIKVFRSRVMLDNEDEEWSKRFDLVLYLIDAYELFYTFLQKDPRLKKLLTKGIVEIFAIEIVETRHKAKANDSKKNNYNYIATFKDLKKRVEDLAKYEKMPNHIVSPDTEIDSSWDYWDQLVIRIRPLKNDMYKFLLKKRYPECFSDKWLFKNKRW